MSITEHISDYLQFCKPYEIDNEESACVLFFLTLEGHANWWCHTMPPYFIHTLHPFLKELHQALDKCNHQDFYERISHLRMKHRKLVEHFSTHLLHLCHEIPEWFVDLEFMSQELKCLVHVS